MPPQTVSDKIIAACRSLRDPMGASAQAIKKYMASELGISDVNLIKRTLKAAVKKKKLEQVGQRFFVVGDERLEAPKEEVVDIVDVTVGQGKIVVKGATVDVQYKGKLVSDDSVFDKAKSFVFTVGDGDVIKGWDMGLIGK